MIEHRDGETILVTGTSVVQVRVRPSASNPERGRDLTLIVNGRPRTSFEIPTWRPLSFGYGLGIAYIWSARTVITLPIESDADLRVLESNEDLLFVFKVEQGWLLVCETSVRLASDEGREVDRIELGDVAEMAHWEGETLVIDDARGLVLTIRLSNGRLMQVI